MAAMDSRTKAYLLWVDPRTEKYLTYNSPVYIYKQLGPHHLAPGYLVIPTPFGGTDKKEFVENLWVHI